ncbi:hypothetical protein GWK47_053291 [Chionoecetes opilio]|uniref:Uncharacterized protein n=1 Tax=Chionoecetes opilio TaxID=41210 RepID=A0A8J4Y0U6_CHIOP|nr:hypothetical protein GWK47_053291 [Chionoecetes opilio]
MKKMNEMQVQLNNGENRGNDQGDFEVELITIKKMMEKQKEKLDEMEKRMDERDEELVRRVTERMNENLEEREDKERRRKNVMMFNVEESEKEDIKEREKDDKELCEYVFKEKLGVEGVEVVKVYRLGTKSRGRERPMVACLSDGYVKWDIIKRSKELRNAREDSIRKIGLAVDKTKREREEDALLKEKLQVKRREGGRWIIKKGKIVSVTEGRDGE